MKLVFDFAGVLFHWRPTALLVQLLPEVARDEASAQALVNGFFQGYDGDWAAFDRGHIEPGPLAERIAVRTGLSVAEARRVVDAVPHELRPMAGTVALLERLHARGHALYFLSNMPAPYAQHLEDAHPFLRLFRGGVFSGRVGLIKPETAIFRHVEAAFDLVPPQTFFIDDVAANVTAGRAAGWRALQFIDPAQCEAALQAEGLL